MNTTELILIVFGGFLVTASFIHLIKLDAWWIRIWDFPHMQLAVLSFICLLGWVVLVRDFSPLGWGMTGALLAAVLYQAWLIAPYTRLKGQQIPAAVKEDPANTISLMIGNIYMDNRRYSEVLNCIGQVDPDVVMIVEADEAWCQALVSLEERYPYRILRPLENTYGMLFYSRLPILHRELRFLVEADIPSIHAVLELKSGQRVHFYGVHPQPPSPTEHDRSTERDAELLLIGKEARQQVEPVIVAGDLNDVAWSHTTRLFQRISGLLDPRVGRGLFNTFHARYFFLRWPLDHIFASHHFKLRSIRRLPHCGSDHFPIHLSLVYNPDPDTRQEIPQPEGDDRQEAREKIEKVENLED